MRCRSCGSMNLQEVTPYWYRCRTCNELTYVPHRVARLASVSRPETGKTRRPYGAETVPLPVLTDPRTRLVEGLLGVTAAGLYAVSIPLAIVLLAGQRRSTIDDLLRAEGVSLIVTLWIFLGIALAATAIFAAILVLRRKAEAGAGWVSFGVIAIVLTIMFVLFGSMNGAWVGVVASGLILGAGLMDTVLAIQKKRASESARLRS